MHYHAEVYLKELGNIERQIKGIMSPHQKQYDEDTDESTGFWDWWQIGGRWKGAHIPEYDAGKDPEHQETCRLCGGTGKRTDMEVANGCNGCKGTGLSTKWPTQWNPHEKDVIPISELPDKLTCYTLVLPDCVLHDQEWNGKDFVDGELKRTIKEALAKHNITDGYLVTVDYHC